MGSLQGKIVIVTGGASGIGAAATRAFHAAGATVVIGDIQDASDIAAEVGGAFLATDVTDAAAVDALVKTTVERYGRLDVYFNNAGIESSGPMAEMDPEVHRRVIDIDVNGVFYGLQAAVKAMLANPEPTGGVVINTASVAGLIGCPGLSSYNAAKGAVVLLTKNAALEYGRAGIRVNAVCPGIVRTPMAGRLVEGSENSAAFDELVGATHPNGRAVEPEEVADLVVFLAGDTARSINGAAIPIDGGLTAGLAPPM